MAAVPFAGLLKGIDDVKTAVSYTNTLDLWPEAFKKEFLWQAATEDANKRNCTPEGHLVGIEKKYRDFSVSQHVTDREDLRAAVEKKIDKIGQLQIILGGQSIGKTKLLRNICAEYSTRSDIGVSDSMPIMVIYVNARKTSLIDGLTAALKDYAEKGWFDSMMEADWDTISAVSFVSFGHL